CNHPAGPLLPNAPWFHSSPLPPPLRKSPAPASPSLLETKFQAGNRDGPPLDFVHVIRGRVARSRRGSSRSSPPAHSGRRDPAAETRVAADQASESSPVFL